MTTRKDAQFTTLHAPEYLTRIWDVESAKREITRLSSKVDGLTSELQATLAVGGDEHRIDSLRGKRRELRGQLAGVQQQVPRLERARRRAELAEHIPVAEMLGTEAQEAARRRLKALRDLQGAIFHAFGALGTFERANEEAEQARVKAETAWRRTGLGFPEARERVGVPSEIPYDLLGKNARLWMTSCLRNLRSARADFVSWLAS